MIKRQFWTRRRFVTSSVMTILGFLSLDALYIPFLPQGSGRYLKGWYKNEGIDLYVSRGIGTSIFPVRFGSRAEVAIFTI